MTFASMTGFAESAGSHEGLRWRWEAKSVNSRSLDLRLRMPPGYDGLEPLVRRLAGGESLALVTLGLKTLLEWKQAREFERAQQMPAAFEGERKFPSPEDFR